MKVKQQGAQPVARTSLKWEKPESNTFNPWPCYRCEQYEKEFKQKDQIIKELQERLRTINRMSELKPVNIVSKLQDAKINTTNVNLGSDTHSIKAASFSFRNFRDAKEKAEEEAEKCKSKISSGVFNVTIQEIIDKVVECTPR